jgi:putative spermidine/putrescine transport system ATP-binding protein
MQIEIRRIHRELGVTTIYVTHDQTEAMTMSDRIVVFNSGKVEQVDAPLALYRRPNTPFVAGFVGDNNVLDAVHGDGGQIELPGIGPIAAVAPSGCPKGALKIAIRPESIRLASANEAPAFAVQGIVNYGDSVVLVGALGAIPLKIRLPGADASNVAVGQSLRIEWPASAVHVIGTAAAE